MLLLFSTSQKRLSKSSQLKNTVSVKLISKLSSRRASPRLASQTTGSVLIIGAGTMNSATKARTLTNGVVSV